MNMEEIMQLKGTYLATRYTQESADRIYKWCEQQKVNRHRAAVDRLHTTILYSKKHIPALPLLEMANIPIEVETGELAIWNTNNSKFHNYGITRALILKVHSPELIQMHERLLTEHDATHDFPDYTPHITLSYDIGKLELKDFEAFPKMKLQLSKLYAEDLIL